MSYREMPLHYHFFHVITRPLFKTLFKFKIYGAENVPQKGGVMLMINHVSYLDPIFIGAAVKRNLHYMARSTLFKKGFIDRFLRSLNAFPVHLGSADRSAIRNALKLLDEGKLLLVFPEGTRSHDGSLGKAQDGVGFMAHRTNACVIPVFLDGTYKAMPRNSKMIKPTRITVSFGKPIDMSIYRNSEANRETYSKIGEDIMSGIAKLKAEREAYKKGKYVME
jgi:1-acyl-sn-glycerol-3-phosphate acyltransferase